MEVDFTALAEAGSHPTLLWMAHQLRLAADRGLASLVPTTTDEDPQSHAAIASVNLDLLVAAAADLLNAARAETGAAMLDPVEVDATLLDRRVQHGVMRTRQLGATRDAIARLGDAPFESNLEEFRATQARFDFPVAASSDALVAAQAALGASPAVLRFYGDLANPEMSTEAVARRMRDEAKQAAQQRRASAMAALGDVNREAVAAEAPSAILNAYKDSRGDAEVPSPVDTSLQELRQLKPLPRQRPGVAWAARREAMRLQLETATHPYELHDTVMELIDAAELDAQKARGALQRADRLGALLNRAHVLLRDMDSRMQRGEIGDVAPVRAELDSYLNERDWLYAQAALARALGARPFVARSGPREESTSSESAGRSETAAERTAAEQHQRLVVAVVQSQKQARLAQHRHVNCLRILEGSERRCMQLVELNASLERDVASYTAQLKALGSHFEPATEAARMRAKIEADMEARTSFMDGQALPLRAALDFMAQEQRAQIASMMRSTGGHKAPPALRDALEQMFEGAVDNMRQTLRDLAGCTVTDMAPFVDSELARKWLGRADNELCVMTRAHSQPGTNEIFAAAAALTRQGWDKFATQLAAGTKLILSHVASASAESAAGIAREEALSADLEAARVKIGELTAEVESLTRQMRYMGSPDRKRAPNPSFDSQLEQAAVAALTLPPVDDLLFEGFDPKDGEYLAVLAAKLRCTTAHLRHARKLAMAAAIAAAAGDKDADRARLEEAEARLKDKLRALSKEFDGANDVLDSMRLLVADFLDAFLPGRSGPLAITAARALGVSATSEDVEDLRRMITSSDLSRRLSLTGGGFPAHVMATRRKSSSVSLALIPPNAPPTESSRPSSAALSEGISAVSDALALAPALPAPAALALVPDPAASPTHPALDVDSLPPTPRMHTAAQPSKDRVSDQSAGSPFGAPPHAAFSAGSAATAAHTSKTGSSRAAAGAASGKATPSAKVLPKHGAPASPGPSAFRTPQAKEIVPARQTRTGRSAHASPKQAALGPPLRVQAAGHDKLRNSLEFEKPDEVEKADASTSMTGSPFGVALGQVDVLAAPSPDVSGAVPSSVAVRSHQGSPMLESLRCSATPPVVADVVPARRSASAASVAASAHVSQHDAAAGPSRPQSRGWRDVASVSRVVADAATAVTPVSPALQGASRSQTLECAQGAVFTLDAAVGNSRTSSAGIGGTPSRHTSWMGPAARASMADAYTSWTPAASRQPSATRPRTAPAFSADTQVEELQHRVALLEGMLCDLLAFHSRPSVGGSVTARSVSASSRGQSPRHAATLSEGVAVGPHPYQRSTSTISDQVVQAAATTGGGACLPSHNAAVSVDEPIRVGDTELSRAEPPAPANAIQPSAQQHSNVTSDQKRARRSGGASSTPDGMVEAAKISTLNSVPLSNAFVSSGEPGPARSSFDASSMRPTLNPGALPAGSAVGALRSNIATDTSRSNTAAVGSRPAKDAASKMGLVAEPSQPVVEAFQLAEVGLKPSIGGGRAHPKRRDDLPALRGSDLSVLRGDLHATTTRPSVVTTVGALGSSFSTHASPRNGVGAALPHNLDGASPGSRPVQSNAAASPQRGPGRVTGTVHSVSLTIPDFSGSAAGPLPPISLNRNVAMARTPDPTRRRVVDDAPAPFANGCGPLVQQSELQEAVRISDMRRVEDALFTRGTRRSNQPRGSRAPQAEGGLRILSGVVVDRIHETLMEQ